MAPRGRQKKVRSSMDAAIDALLPLGFSKDLVRKTVNALLKVYGGDEGWPFIEDASYKLVLDTILENQEEEKEGKLEHDPGENEPRDLDADEQSCAIARSAETSKASESLGESTYIKMDREVEFSRPNDNIPSSGEEMIGHVLEATYAGEVAESIRVHPSYLQTENNDSLCRRKPCYGWISDDDSDNEDYKVEGTLPVSVPQINVTAQCPTHSPCKKNRISRWDMKPSDMF